MAIVVKPAINEIWAERGEVSSPTSLKILRGWVVEIPPHQQMNWWQQRVDKFLASVNQRGIAPWDAETQYYANLSYVSSPTTGIVYRAVADSRGSSPDSTVGFWQEAYMQRVSAYTKAEIDAFRNADRTYVDSAFLQKTSNLGDVPNKSQARQNLNVLSIPEGDAKYLNISKNLDDLTDVLAARTKLSVMSRQESEAAFLAISKNFSDVQNKPLARANLGLGAAAVLGVGNTVGTVAAGDDSRIVNATPRSRLVATGWGLVGGGDLTVDRVLSLGTPSTVTATSANTLIGTSHTHALDLSAAFRFVRNANGVAELPNGMKMVWGISSEIPAAYEGVVNIPFHEAFNTACLNVQLTILNGSAWGSTGERIVGLLGNETRLGCQANIGYISNPNGTSYIKYFAVGY